MLVAVHDASQVAAAGRASSGIAKALGFDEARTSRSALLATELATVC